VSKECRGCRLGLLQGGADVKMDDAVTDGDAAAATEVAASVQQEGLATESADGAAAAVKEEAEEVQEAAPAGAPSATACRQCNYQMLRSRGRRPGTVNSQGCLHCMCICMSS
jgi:hypothetical protein